MSRIHVQECAACVWRRTVNLTDVDNQAVNDYALDGLQWAWAVHATTEHPGMFRDALTPEGYDRWTEQHGGYQIFGNGDAEHRLHSRRCRCGKHVTVDHPGCVWHHENARRYADDLHMALYSEHATAPHHDTLKPQLQGETSDVTAERNTTARTTDNPQVTAEIQMPDPAPMAEQLMELIDAAVRRALRAMVLGGE